MNPITKTKLAIWNRTIINQIETTHGLSWEKQEKKFNQAKRLFEALKFRKDDMPTSYMCSGCWQQGYNNKTSCGCEYTPVERYYLNRKGQPIDWLSGEEF